MKSSSPERRPEAAGGTRAGVVLAPVIAFVAAPGLGPAVRAHPLIRARAPGRAVTRPFAVAIFDTPEGALRGAGLIVRVVRRGTRFEQTVIRDGRTAFRGPVPTEAPVPAAIADEDLRQLAAPAAVGGRPALFRRRGTRTRLRLRLGEGGHGAIEIEDGEVLTGGTRRACARLYVEADPTGEAAAWELSRALAEAFALRPAVRDPETEAFDLAMGRPNEPVKAVKPPLDPAATVEDVMVLIARTCLDHLLANEDCVLDSDDPEGIHQARVAMRRLRSGLRFFRDMIPAPQYDAIVDDLRWLTARMGPARDLDVFMDEILTPVARALPDLPGFAVLTAVARAGRDQARADARAALRDPRHARLVTGLAAWLATREWRDQPAGEGMARLFLPVHALAGPALAKRHKRVRARGRNFANLDAAERHLLRIDVKKLRYALDFFGSLYRPKEVAAYLARLSRLQDALGYANDVAVASALVDRLCGAARTDAEAARLAGGAVIGWHAHAMAGIEGEIGADIADLLDCKAFWSRPGPG